MRCIFLNPSLSSYFINGGLLRLITFQLVCFMCVNEPKSSYECPHDYHHHHMDDIIDLFDQVELEDLQVTD